MPEMGQNEDKGRDRISKTLYILYVIFLGVAVFIVIRIACLKLNYTVDERIKDQFVLTDTKRDLTPVRGSILSHDGRPLALSVTEYETHVDCTLQPVEDVVWSDCMKTIASGFANTLIDKRPEDYYLSLMQNGFMVKDPKVKLGGKISRTERDALLKLPVINKGKRFSRVYFKMAGIGKYQPYMACDTVLVKEVKWADSLKVVADGLAALHKDKSAEEYYKILLAGRKRGDKNLKVGGTFYHEDYINFMKLPLIRRGKNRSGVKVDMIEKREYPYGDLARKTIGNIVDNSKLSEPVKNPQTGLEGSFDYALHGEDGFEWMRVTDKREDKIQNTGRESKPAVDGKDIRTTIDIDLQEIADRTLRANIEDKQDIEGGCVILMEVKTGAIRAMVNLHRERRGGGLAESLNYALSESGEPGSVFKTATLMSLMEDYGVTLSSTVPTNGGVNRPYPNDASVRRYEANTGKHSISAGYGLERSVNYVFQKLTVENYGKDDPQKLINRLHSYWLGGEDYDFDITGVAPSWVPAYGSNSWSRTTLGSVATGYTVSETPLHIVTFYNAIANKGRLMKPYLVESIEKNGEVVEERGPVVLDEAICSAATADSLTKGLVNVVLNGTGKGRVKGASLQVAGKTGTSWQVLDKRYYNVSAKDPYTTVDGKKRYRATFVGFFPAEVPKYTAIAVLFSYPSGIAVNGSGLPAKTVREIVDKIYLMDADYGRQLTRTGVRPAWTKGE